MVCWREDKGGQVAKERKTRSNSVRQATSSGWYGIYSRIGLDDTTQVGEEV